MSIWALVALHAQKLTQINLAGIVTLENFEFDIVCGKTVNVEHYK